jgi:hypothetical protein
VSCSGAPGGMVTPPQPCNSGHLADIVTTVQTVFQQLCINRELQWWESTTGATCLSASQYSAAGAMMVYALKVKGRHVADVCLVNPESMQERMMTDMAAELPAFGRRVTLRVLTLRELSQRMDAVARGKFRNDGMPYFALAVNLPAATQAAMRLAFVNFAYAAGLLHSVPTTLHFDPERRYQCALHILDRMVDFAMSSRPAPEATEVPEHASEEGAGSGCVSGCASGSEDGEDVDGGSASCAAPGTLPVLTTDDGSPPTRSGCCTRDVGTETDEVPVPTPCEACAVLQGAVQAAEQQAADASAAAAAATAATAAEVKARNAAVARHSSLEGKWAKERDNLRREMAAAVSARVAADKTRAKVQTEAAAAAARSAADVQRLRAELQQAQAAADAQAAAHARVLVAHQEELAKAQEQVRALESKVVDMQQQVAACKTAAVTAAGASEDAKRQLRDIQEWVLHDRKEHEAVLHVELVGLRAEVVREFAGVTGQLLQAHKALQALHSSVAAHVAECLEGMAQDRLDHDLWKPMWGLWGREACAASRNFRELFQGGAVVDGSGPGAAPAAGAAGAAVCPVVDLAVQSTAFVVKTLHLSAQFGAKDRRCGGVEEKQKQRSSGCTVEHELADEALWRNMVYTQEGETVPGSGCAKDDLEAREMLRRVSELGGCRARPCDPQEVWSPEVLATCRALWQDLLVQHVLRPVAAVWSMRQGDVAQQLDNCHALVGSLIDASRTASGRVLAVLQRVKDNLCKAQLTAPFENAMAAPASPQVSFAAVPLVSVQVCVEAVEPRLPVGPALPLPALMDKPPSPNGKEASDSGDDTDDDAVLLPSECTVAHADVATPACGAATTAGADTGAGAGAGAASVEFGSMPVEVKALLGADASAFERLYGMVFPKGLDRELQAAGDATVGPCVTPTMAQFVFAVPGLPTPSAVFLSDMDLFTSSGDGNDDADSPVPTGKETELRW